MTDEQKKTRWCEQCHKRHELTHPHFEGVADKAANTVTGSKSGADLAEQAAKGKKGDARASIQKLEAEREKQERELLSRRWERRCAIVYGFFSKVLDDPSIALSDFEKRDAGEVHADMCIAFGWTAGGKIETVADVAMFHMAAVTARSEWGQAILEKMFGEKEKPANETDRGEATQEPFVPGVRV